MFECGTRAPSILTSPTRRSAPSFTHSETIEARFDDSVTLQGFSQRCLGPETTRADFGKGSGPFLCRSCCPPRCQRCNFACQLLKTLGHSCNLQTGHHLWCRAPDQRFLARTRALGVWRRRQNSRNSGNSHLHLRLIQKRRSNQTRK